MADDVLDSSGPTAPARASNQTVCQGHAVPAFLPTMKFLLPSLTVFFATLLAAAMVAFGEPGAAEVRMVAAQSAPGGAVVAQLFGDELAH